MKNTLLISAFPCSGKTTASNSLSEFYDFADSDSSNFSWLNRENNERNPDFPNNYINHIKSLCGKKDVIFISSHKSVRNALEKNNMNYFLVYPENSVENKEEWINRMRSRGNNEELISFISDNWDFMLDDMSTEMFPVHYVLGNQDNATVIDANVINVLMDINNGNHCQ